METESTPKDAGVTEPEKKPTVHIDTSLQIEQQKVEKLSGPVRRALDQYTFRLTSTYAKKEFKRAWLQDLNLVYKAAENCKDIGEVYTKIAKSLWHPQARRRLERCMDAIGAFLEPYPEIPVGVAAIRLRAHLGEMILGAFPKWDRSVTHQFNGTDCIRAKERPERGPGGSIDAIVRQCKPAKIQCKVHHFFEDNRDAFRTIASAIEENAGSSKELRETLKTIRVAQKDSTCLCDNENCSSMSDALIAVDGIKMDHFAANNDKEWGLLARALGKTLVNPVSAQKNSSRFP